MVFRKLIISIIFFLSYAIPAAGGQGSEFVFSQLKYPGNWDPYPESHSEILHYLETTTSMRVQKERRVVDAGSKLLFSSPFLFITGKGRYPEFNEQEILNLRRYVEGGGIILLDTCGDAAFNECADRTFSRVLPGYEYRKIPQDHAVFRSFYLIDYVSGRIINTPYLEGIVVDSRYSVIKSANDLAGVWPRDPMGNWKYKLVPGNYRQRKEAVKLTLNILMYSVCGTYKNDPVHEPSIKRKLGR